MLGGLPQTEAVTLDRYATAWTAGWHTHSVVLFGSATATAAQKGRLHQWAEHRGIELFLPIDHGDLPTLVGHVHQADHLDWATWTATLRTDAPTGPQRSLRGRSSRHIPGAAGDAPREQRRSPRGLARLPRHLHAHAPDRPLHGHLERLLRCLPPRQDHDTDAGEHHRTARRPAALGNPRRSTDHASTSRSSRLLRKRVPPDTEHRPAPHDDVPDDHADLHRRPLERPAAVPPAHPSRRVRPLHARAGRPPTDRPHLLGAPDRGGHPGGRRETDRPPSDALPDRTRRLPHPQAITTPRNRDLRATQACQRMAQRCPAPPRIAVRNRIPTARHLRHRSGQRVHPTRRPKPHPVTTDIHRRRRDRPDVRRNRRPDPTRPRLRRGPARARGEGA